MYQISVVYTGHEDGENQTIDIRFLNVNRPGKQKICFVIFTKDRLRRIIITSNQMHKDHLHMDSEILLRTDHLYLKASEVHLP